MDNTIREKAIAMLEEQGRENLLRKNYTNAMGAIGLAAGISADEIYCSGVMSKANINDYYKVKELIDTSDYGAFDDMITILKELE